jgi:xylulose-5-phosphate/fructose-6-phosphate phosphoketolase
MCVRNNIDRYQLALDAILRIPRLAWMAKEARQRYTEQIEKHRLYVAENGQDLPEIRNWKWAGR